MCTLAVYFREFEDYPLVVAANRDEHFSRPSLPPRILTHDPKIFGGQDLAAGGTWLGVNEHGLVAAIVNRRVAAAPNPNEAPRSRGLLCLDMLLAKNAAQAGEWLEREDGSKYSPFILLIAGTDAAFVIFNAEHGNGRMELDQGVHIFSNTSFADSDGGKLSHARRLFSTAGISLRARLKSPATSHDSAVEILQGVLSDHQPANNSREPKDALCVHIAGADYGTVSSSIIFRPRSEKRFYYYHAPGAPCRAAFQAVEPPPLS